MDDIRKVLIVGAGIGGLGAGAALAQRGVEVEIVEIKPEPNVYGVGINQPGNSLRALQTLGVLEEVCDLGFEFDRWKFHDAHGDLVGRRALASSAATACRRTSASPAATCTTS